MARPVIFLKPLWPEGAHLLVAVSGGADSVALLRLLVRRRESEAIRLTAVHLHHGIRGRAADRDAAFVQSLATAWNVPCIVGRARVPAAAQRTGESLEMAARRARHAFFQRVLRKTGSYAVALAHTADDQAETVLLRLLRGSGPQGLGGIAPDAQIGSLRVVRPLLTVTRGEIEAYLRAEGIAWREDRSNRDLSILRNRVRHALLPALEKSFQPAIRRILCRTAEILREEQALLDPSVERTFARCADAAGRLSVTRLQNLDLAWRRRVVLHWLRSRGVPEARLDSALAERILAMLDGGAPVPVAGGRIARRVGIWLLLSRPQTRPASCFEATVLAVPGRVVRPDGTVLTAERSIGLVRPACRKPGAIPALATIRPPRRGEKLAIRAPWPGARIAPIGLDGSVKLQDLFVNAKVPRARRARIPVVACGDEVVWIPGYRVARRWAVSGESASSVTLRVDFL